MGGWGSGRSGGRPTADASKRIDIAWMIRTSHAVPGKWLRGILSWSSGGSPAGLIRYDADMRDLEAAELRLSYWHDRDPDGELTEQTVRLVSTLPNYGGRRWWMICPFLNNRVSKLYLPIGGDRFAGRRAWRLGYYSQRVAPRDRQFEKLFRLQKKLGCDQGYEAGIYRPKGMWRRTFQRHSQEYEAIERECDFEMALVMDRLRLFG